MCLFQFWLPRGVRPAGGFLGHMAILLSVFLRNLHTVLIVALVVWSPTNGVRGFPFSTPSPAFIICKLFDGSDSDLCEMVPHCGFDLHFSDNE